MLLRIVAVVILAAIFFGIGAWSGGRFPPIREAVVAGTHSTAEKANEFWLWVRDGPAGRETARLWGCVREGAPPQASETSTQARTEASIATARAAFARGDLQGAVSDYRAVLSETPDDPDILGELGNVYFASGQTVEAAEAFHAAALAMIEAGKDDQARALIPTIRNLAPALADDLAARLAAPAGAVRP
jgi:tetratricopeptide (TPR) repeat protein